MKILRPADELKKAAEERKEILGFGTSPNKQTHLGRRFLEMAREVYGEDFIFDKATIKRGTGFFDVTFESTMTEEDFTE